MRSLRTAIKGWVMSLYASGSVPAALVSALFIVFRLRDL